MGVKMKHISLIVILIISLLATSQEPTNSGNDNPVKPTYILELRQPQADKPIRIDVRISEVEKQRYISIPLPGGEPIKAELHVVENEVKFQLTAFKNKGLVAIQYVGKGQLDNEVKGNFSAMVDGVFRKDMSGTFRLFPK